MSPNQALRDRKRVSVWNVISRDEFGEAEEFGLVEVEAEHSRRDQVAEASVHMVMWVKGRRDVGNKKRA